MKGEARVPLQPSLHPGVLVGSVVVEHHMDRLVGRHLALDGIEKADEFLMPMALHAASDDLALEDIEGGEQSGGAMAAADGAVQYSRRLRELREQEGWKILSHNDSTTLKPGQYLLVEPPSPKGHVTIERGISAKLWAQVFDRNGFTCQMCGLTPRRRRTLILAEKSGSMSGIL